MSLCLFRIGRPVGKIATQVVEEAFEREDAWSK